MFDTSIYTIGWVCAIPPELVAARLHLDAEHDDVEYEASPNDNNSYVFGSIGRHNVVIATLPRGEYGTSSAASVARDLIRSFTNVRIGLMVGIGGGAPLVEQDEKKKQQQQQDVRLGDVVVSTPENARGGVCQYDYGKAVQGQQFVLTAHLNSPPQSLLAAVTVLSTDFDLYGSGIEGDISTLLASYPKLQKVYQRPDVTTDRLYKSSFVHQDDTRSCLTGCDSEEQIVKRPDRNEDEESVMIHYGLVASANTLLKDALLRDTFATKFGVLCFEMEAAGLVNQLAFLVIRGICDYADSHKNKEWQGYAAMTAAAYTRKLLLRLAPGKVCAEPKLSELKEVQQILQNVSGGLKEVHELVKDHKQSTEEENIRKWFSAVDPQTNHRRALDVRHQGSGGWLLKNDLFQQSSKSKSLLWLYGISGCGKTVLASTIIEYFQQTVSESQVVLYFYFDFQDPQKQTFESMLRSLITQIYYRHYHSDCRKPLHDLFDACEKGKDQPSEEQLRGCFNLMIGKAPPVKVIIDALDECTTRDYFFPWIQEMGDCRNLQLIITSRPEHDIKKIIEHQVFKQAIIAIQDEAVHEDIKLYVSYRIRSDEKSFGRWRNHPDVLEQIESTIIKKAAGMFRWAACQLDALGDCINPRMLRVALASLPKDLNDTYTRILQRVPDNIRPETTRILQLLTFSDRPLEIREVIDALAVSLDDQPEFDRRWRMPDVSELAVATSSLVTYTTISIIGDSPSSPNRFDRIEVQALKLAHLSVKEYLLSSKVEGRFKDAICETAARSVIAKICLTYLLHIEYSLSPRKIQKEFPFARYSAQHWADHIVTCPDATVHRLLLQFLTNNGQAYVGSLQLLRGHDFGEASVPLYYVALRGLQPVIKDLADRVQNVNIIGGVHGTALQAASVRGHEQVVRILLEAGANINTGGGEHGNALQAAISGKHLNVVQILLEAGANVNALGGKHGTILQALSANGYEKAVKMLLDAGADVNARGNMYGNALQVAIFGKHENTVKMLLKAGADVNAPGGMYGTALQAAINVKHENIVQMLVDMGADVNGQEDKYRSILQSVSADGYEKVVQILVDAGAYVNAQGWHYTALQAASDRGHERVVQILLKAGANVNAQGWYGNALKAAATGGHERVVQILLDAGADVRAQKGYNSALQVASARGHEEVVLILLNAGADVNIRGSYNNALEAASAGGHESVVQILLDGGADIGSQSTYNRALQAASAGGHEKVVQILLNLRVNIGIQRGYSSALKTASDAGHEKVVQMLLKIIFPDSSDRREAWLLRSALLRKDLVTCTTILAGLDSTQILSRLQALGLPKYEQFNGRIVRYQGQNGFEYVRISRLIG